MNSKFNDLSPDYNSPKSCETKASYNCCNITQKSKKQDIINFFKQQNDFYINIINSSRKLIKKKSSVSDIKADLLDNSNYKIILDFICEDNIDNEKKLKWYLLKKVDSKLPNSIDYSNYIWLNENSINIKNFNQSPNTYSTETYEALKIQNAKNIEKILDLSDAKDKLIKKYNKRLYDINNADISVSYLIKVIDALINKNILDSNHKDLLRQVQEELSRASSYILNK